MVAPDDRADDAVLAAAVAVELRSLVRDLEECGCGREAKLVADGVEVVFETKLHRVGKSTDDTEHGNPFGCDEGWIFKKNEHSPLFKVLMLH